MDKVVEKIDEYIAGKLMLYGIYENYGIVKGQNFSVKIHLENKETEYRINKYVNLFVDRLLLEQKELEYEIIIDNAVKEVHGTWIKYNEKTLKSRKHKRSLIKNLTNVTKSLHKANLTIKIVNLNNDYKK